MSPVKKPTSTDNEEIWPRYCIEIRCEENTVYLKTNTSEDMEVWMKKLEEASKSIF